MKLCLVFVSLGAITCQCPAQLTDTRFKADISLTYVNATQSSPEANFYTPLGRYSTFGLRSEFTAGFSGFISQRLQRIPGDADLELFDEYYVEDEGFWRLGKQYVPFGGGTLIRESVRAARGDNNLILEGIPVAIAIVDSGTDRQSGIIGRIGGKSAGFSFAVGRHFGINASSLATIRKVEDSPGPGRGWRRAFGFDVNRKFKKLVLKIDAVVLSGGETENDLDLQVGDFFASYDVYKRVQISAGVSLIRGQSDTFTRAAIAYTAYKGVTVESMIRHNNRQFVDFSVTLRTRF